MEHTQPMPPDPDPVHDSIFVRRLDLGGDGPRVGIKDSIDIAGYPTQAGSAVFERAPPALRHADVVAALLDGGCRLVGKTNMHELAYGVTGINRWTGTPVNPRYPDRVPGGSSSGSAVAVAAGLVDFALGTDTGGSIRIPAACCGVYGLKPTYGRVSRNGVHPARSSLDCVGPFARDLQMLERAMTLIDPTFTSTATPANVSLAVFEVDARPPIGAAVRGALEGAGVRLITVRLPSFGAAFDAGLAIIAAENWAAYGHLIDDEGLGPDIRSRLLAARDFTPARVAAAERVRAALQAEVDAALEGVDALALPTLSDHPLTLAAAADARAALAMTALVRPFNLSGHPALAVPLDPAAPLPVSLQLVGRRGADAALCAAARRLLAHRAPSSSSNQGR
jgi:amidase